MSGGDAVEMSESYQGGAGPDTTDPEAALIERRALGSVESLNEAEKYRQQAQNEGYSCRPCGIYDSAQMLGNLKKYHGTVLPGLFHRPSFWICIVVYAASTACFKLEDQCGAYVPQIALGDLGTPQGLLVFFLVFYSNQCYGRFRGEYKNLKKIEGNLRTLASIARHAFCVVKPENTNDSHVKYKSIELMRLFGASYYLMFACLYKGEMHEFNLKSAYQAGLLTFQETEALRPETRGMRWYRCLDWAYQVIVEAVEEGACEKKAEKELAEMVLKTRELMNDIVFEFQMPIPLAYYHLITLLTLTVTVLYSFAAGSETATNSLFGLVYLTSIIGLLGIREVGMQMAEPFGDDDTDLPVDMYVMNALEFVTHFIEVAGVTRPRKNQRFANGSHWVSRAHRPDDVTFKVREVINGGQAKEDELAAAAGAEN